MSNITVREIHESEKKVFDQVSQHPVQSWEWGEFRKQMGNKIVRLGKFEEKKLTETCLLTIHKIPKIKYSLGIFTQGQLPSQEMLNALKEFAIKNEIIFIRLEPRVKKSVVNNPTAILSINGIVLGHPFFNSSTYFIDLTKTEEELLQNMHPKTRYNIRVADRHGVEVAEDNSDEAFETYLNLMDETTKRQSYFAHTENYHKKMWEIFKKTGTAHLFLARYKNKILAAWILFVWHDFLYYPYGASSSESREVMATTKMMWEAIKFGKKKGLKTFDLWGADEKKGYTRFKSYFGPKLVEMIGTYDLVINKPLYFLYRIAEEVRWFILKTKANIFKGTSSFR